MLSKVVFLFHFLSFLLVLASNSQYNDNIYIYSLVDAFVVGLATPIQKSMMGIPTACQCHIAHANLCHSYRNSIALEEEAEQKRPDLSGASYSRHTR